MTLQIGLKWPVDKSALSRGVAVYAAGEKAKQLLAAGNEQEFRLEAGSIITAQDGEHGQEAASFAQRLSSSTPSTNRHRPICRLEASDKKEYDIRITFWPGNRANFNEALKAIKETLRPDGAPEEVIVTYV